MRCNTITILAILFFTLASAQDGKTITGTIVDPTGLPLPGAEVKILNKEIFDITDFDGNFSLQNVEVGDSFRITFLGFIAQEVAVTQENEYQITLEEDAAELDEVVVVGYGTQRRQDLTGAISSVSSEEIVQQPASTATQALQGKVAGVNIVRNDAPGSTPSVTIRGLGTALGGRDPLYVVDGTPVNDIRNISPSSIESMDFLKDASSAAIYGVRAANGVIIITTKDGQSGAPVFNLSSYTGFKNILNPVDMANASQYITYFNQENSAVGGDLLSTSQTYNTDWYDVLTQTGFVTNNVFSVSGGGDFADYYFGFDYYEEQGVLPDQKFRRSTITSNNTFDIFEDRLRIIQNFNMAIANERPKDYGVFNVAYRQSPLVPVFYENGRYGQPFYNRSTGEATYIPGEGESIGRLTSHGNPRAELDFQNQKNRNLTLQGSVAAELSITDDLTFTSRFGARKYYSKQRGFSPIKRRWLANDPSRTSEEFEAQKAANPESLTYANNSLGITDVETFNYNWDNFLNYSRYFGDHFLDVTLGMAREEIGSGSYSFMQGYDLPDAEQYWSINHATDAYEKQVEQYYYTPTRYMSYFGRVQYNFRSKYFFTGTLRRDGASTFRNNADYWGTFPALGIGWTLTQEEFLIDNQTINLLKLRASWGELGNANVPFNATQILTNPGSGNQNYVFGPDQQLYFGAYIGSPAQNLSWEVVSEYSMGLDYELFDYRLSGTIDYYHRTTENTILQVEPLLNSTFSTDFYDHGAEVVNSGVEFAANWTNQVSDNFTYNVGVNFSYNHNEVTEVRSNYEGQTGGDLANGEIAKRLAAGQPLGSWWMYDVGGVWQSQDEIDNGAAIGGARPGHLRYIDQNNDGSIDDRDKVYLGSYLPTYNFGISMGLNYKNWDFSVDGYGAGGNKVYNGLKSTRIGGENISREMFEDRWTEQGSTNSHPGADRDARASSYYLEDGDFFRINNITLGYTLPEFSDFVKNARVYFSAQNPFIFTKYSGFTPEISADGNPYGTTGIELSAYPNISTFLVGLNIEL